MPLLVAVLLFVASAAPLCALQGARGAAVPPSHSGATVSGQVRSERTGAPLPYAVVELVMQLPRPITALSDSNGIYELRDVPAGRRLLRVTHLDHAANEVELLVVAGRKHPIDFDLEFRPLRLDTVTAQGARTLPTVHDTVHARDAELGPANVRVLDSSPGVAELGLPEAARDAPGHEPVDPADVLYVRGGSADLKLVLLNGAPVYAPFHIGGLIHALDADVLRSATLHVGGAPARHDGGLSYIMDLETRSGASQAFRGTIGFDMIAGHALFEGPITQRASVLVSSRNVHGIGARSLMGGRFPYGYGDALGRADIQLGRDHALSATGFWNREAVTLDSVGTIVQTARWGNNAGSLRYRGALSGTEVLASVTGGRFRTLLPLGGIRPLITEGTALRGKVTLDLERRVWIGRLYWGLSFERIDYEHRAFQHGTSRDEAVVKSGAGGDIAGAYVETTFSPVRRVRIRGGARADYFTSAPSIQVGPRVAATVLLTERASITLSGGKYHQYVREPERSLVFLGNAVPDSSARPALGVAEATHLVLGLLQDFDEGIRFGLEGYFKQFEGLKTGSTSRTAASGVDLWVRRSTGALTGWLGYSLGWVWAVESDWTRPTQSFSGRHLVSAGVVGPLVGRGEFDVRVSYGAGLPYTAIPEPEPATPAFSVLSLPGAAGGGGEPSPVPGEPRQPYIRVDAQVARTFDGRVGSFAFTMTPYLKIINALNRRDAIFYHYNRDVGRAEPLADLPIVPIFGIEWKF